MFPALFITPGQFVRILQFFNGRFVKLEGQSGES